MQAFLAAIRFLTIMPIPGSWGTDSQSLAKSPVFFPLTGLLIGLPAALFIYLSAPFIPIRLAVVLTIMILLTASGALHMDGVADCADGFFSSRPREQMMTIMRDSRIGPMGVMAIIIILMLKYSALMSINGSELWRPILLAPIAGRCAIVIMMWITPYARPEGGLGSVFYQKNMTLSGLWALMFLAASAYLTAGNSGLIFTGIIVSTVIIFSLYCRKKINGATGDTLGAICEISETVTACTLAVLPLGCAAILAI